jgi:uncharacterized protein
MHWILFYDLVDDYLERRAPLRQEHLALATQSRERGELILGGALADPPDGALLVFTADDPAPVERFVENDPYVREGLVTTWRIRKWNEVVARGV